MYSDSIFVFYKKGIRCIYVHSHKNAHEKLGRVCAGYCLSLGNELKKRYTLLLLPFCFEFHYFYSEKVVSLLFSKRKKKNGYLEIWTFHGMSAKHFRNTKSYVTHQVKREPCLETQRLALNSFPPGNNVIVTKSNPVIYSCFIINWNNNTGLLWSTTEFIWIYQMYGEYLCNSY